MKLLKHPIFWCGIGILICLYILTPTYVKVADHFIPGIFGKSHRDSIQDALDDRYWETIANQIDFYKEDQTYSGKPSRHNPRIYYLNHKPVKMPKDFEWGQDKLIDTLTGNIYTSDSLGNLKTFNWRPNK